MKIVKLFVKVRFMQVFSKYQSAKDNVELQAPAAALGGNALNLEGCELTGADRRGRPVAVAQRPTPQLPHSTPHRQTFLYFYNHFNAYLYRAFIHHILPGGLEMSKQLAQPSRTNPNKTLLLLNQPIQIGHLKLHSSLCLSEPNKEDEERQ